VPADIAITGPDTIALTTHHRSATYSYPVTTQQKTATTTTARRHHWDYAIDTQDARGLYATCGNNVTAHCGRTSGPSDEGAVKVRKALNATVARHVMTEGACDKYATPGADLSNLDPSTDNWGAWACRQAADNVNAAISAKMRPFITIEWRHGKTLNPVTYANSLAKLWQAAPFNKVKDWAPTNEPDSNSLPASTAADIFIRVQSRARGKDPSTGKARCPNCRMIAGEFSKDPPKSTQDTYIKDYIDRLRNKNVYPLIWGFHAYDDVIMAPPNGHKFPELHNFIYKRLKVFSKPRRVWVSEQGVLLSNRGGLTRLDGRVDRQISAAQRFLNVHTVSRQIDEVGYYEFFGKAGDWDSGLVMPADPPEDPITTKDFRPAYCVLTNRLGTADLCAHTSGH
jgi:hypothetical protein